MKAIKDLQLKIVEADNSRKSGAGGYHLSSTDHHKDLCTNWQMPMVLPSAPPKSVQDDPVFVSPSLGPSDNGSFTTALSPSCCG